MVLIAAASGLFQVVSRVPSALKRATELRDGAGAADQTPSKPPAMMRRPWESRTAAAAVPLNKVPKIE